MGRAVIAGRQDDGEDEAWQQDECCSGLLLAKIGWCFQVGLFRRVVLLLPLDYDCAHARSLEVLATVLHIQLFIEKITAVAVLPTTNPENVIHC
jgi:hypothetical protein